MLGAYPSRRIALAMLLRMRSLRGEILDPHGEGAAKPRVSNHEAQHDRRTTNR
jgi:hypothetical protein